MKKILYAFVLGMCLYGCSSDEEIVAVTGSLAGSVSDQSTGEPVATVNVTLVSGSEEDKDDYYPGYPYYPSYPVYPNDPSYPGGGVYMARGEDYYDEIEIPSGGLSSVTGSDGSFSFPDLTPGVYTLYISKEGYRSDYEEFVIKAGQTTPAHLLIERIPATIKPDREWLDFGSNESTTMLSFVIVNKNYETLEYTLEYDCPWIKEVNPRSGSLGTGKTGTIVVNIDRSKLVGGHNETVLVVRTSNGRAEIRLIAQGSDKSLPVINTLDATEVGAMSAVLNAEITNVGTPGYTERGFVYSTTSGPTLETTLKKLTAPVTSDNKYSCTLDGLTVGKTYYVRAYAINSVGTAYSTNEIHFTTQAVLPKLTVQQATDVNVGIGSAVLHGTVENLGYPAATEVGFVYSQFSNPTVDDNKVASSRVAKGAYSVRVSNLPLDQTFYVRAYAISAGAVAYSSESVQLSTHAIAPVVATLEAQDVDISNGTATLVGRIDNVGTPGYTERGFVYSTMHDPTVNDNKIVANGSGVSGRFSVYTTELPAGKTVYIRAYATSERAGTVYGEEIALATDWVVLNAAGIAVQKNDLGDAYWNTAKAMCENSTLGGYTDWRLPTKEELMVLYNNRELIGGFTTDGYWSSSPDSGGWYYYIYFGNGSLSSSRGNLYSYKVRAVRTLK